MIWWYLLLCVIGLGLMEFFTRYSIERVEEEVDWEGTYVEADTLEELIAELQKLPPDTDITKFFIVPKE